MSLLDRLIRRDDETTTTGTPESSLPKRSRRQKVVRRPTRPSPNSNSNPSHRKHSPNPIQNPSPNPEGTNPNTDNAKASNLTRSDLYLKQVDPIREAIEQQGY